MLWGSYPTTHTQQVSALAKTTAAAAAAHAAIDELLRDAIGRSAASAGCTDANRWISSNYTDPLPLQGAG